MRKLLLLLSVLFALGCNPNKPYASQEWYNEDSLSEYDRSIIERIDTATTIDELFPPEWYGDPGCPDE